ncbi:MAG: glycosyltransferase family 39 protein [Acidobacteria bacterium]|nr:glycosyltransferase family 39 protein [Acidobacteriota bacterium]MBI3656434.1 glycosyltransferase family 39 protein [Acidobacteriota bacterium]
MARPNRVWWLLLLAVPYFINLGASSIWDINEAFYVEAPREMMEAHDYLTPRFNYRDRLEKPILSYWVILPFYAVFGAGEFAERLPIALIMTLTLIVVYRLGAVLFGGGAGLFSAAVLATSFKVFWLAHRSLIDMLLLFCVTAALYFAVLALNSNEARCRVYYARFFFIMMGLGTLAKGLLGLLIPGAIVLIYLILWRDWAAVKRLRPQEGVGLYLLVCAPWYGAMFFRHGWSYIQFFFGGHHIDRFLYGSYSIARPIWFYVPTLLGGFMPWSFFLLPALVYSIQTYARGVLNERRSLSFLAIWFSFIFIFFSLARAKQEEYIFQLYPAGALAVGYYFGRLREQAATSTLIRRRWLIFSTILASALFGLMSTVYWHIAVKLFGPQYFFNWIPTIGWTLAAILLLWMLVLRRDHLIFNITAGAAFFFLIVLTAVILPDCERFRPVKALSARISAEAQPTDLVGYYRLAVPSLCYYTRRPIFEVFAKERLESILCQTPRAFCVMEEKDYNELRRNGLCTLYVWESRPKLVTTLKGFLAFWQSGQLPNVLLVSNQPPGVK